MARFYWFPRSADDAFHDIHVRHGWMLEAFKTQSGRFAYRVIDPLGGIMEGGAGASMDEVKELAGNRLSEILENPPTLPM